MTANLPSPRPAVASPSLWRPDWTQGALRNSRKCWLDKNENCDPELAQLVSGILSELPPETLSTYPEAAPLYRKLAKHLGREPEQLVLGAGSDGCIRAVFEAFISPGDVVVRPDPTFAMYGVYCAMFGADDRVMDYAASDSGPVLGPEEVLSAIREHRPKLVCLPNPDSPTGTVFDQDALAEFAAAAEAVGALLLIDEAYYPFYADSVMPWVGRHRNLIVTRSTGKAWGIAGLRIGFMAADAEIAQSLHKVAPMYDASTIAVAMLEKLLDHEADMLASVERLRAGKAHFLKAMGGLGFRTLETQGNFLHVAFAGKAAEIHERLEPIVYYRKDFNEDCLKGFSRFSATTIDGFRPVIEAIGQAGGG